ncbi:hypothetical protein Y032_0191g1306 [Ancylostoma ceylanicum]|uniref:Uncharacterized protein n=1 Tax=Ancylostoma ceylanicum TaxID=53326 RepID=A0A016SQM7_9BILA|nr:hypothetical protein Y032_0191g1306 [Ancylostoma ceylanicum]
MTRVTTAALFWNTVASSCRSHTISFFLSNFSKTTYIQCASMTVSHPRPRRGRRATAPLAPERLSSAVGVLFLSAFLPNLVIFSLFSCFITRSSIMVANDIDSCARCAVARRAHQSCEWVTTIDAHCTVPDGTRYVKLLSFFGSLC